MKNWRTTAIDIINNHVENPTFHLNIQYLAQTLKISRQTIWRDKAILSALKSAQSKTLELNTRKASKTELVIKNLKSENQHLRAQQDNLLFKIATIAQRLRDINVDPIIVMSDLLDLEAQQKKSLTLTNSIEGETS
ncbi:HTH domain-containing protein [Pseudomonas poae]|uniref:HTH domain-containing protein n=1 Tax=Pseudomonas poae TaxID=200451 RepID=UPI001F2C3C71|nr:HTH domain-containing protein [Pseudomonas poae]MCF5775536.1 HTH domain-containing protein [Pseudomonas poae]